MNAQHPVQTVAQRRQLAAVIACASARHGVDAARKAQIELEWLLEVKRATEAGRRERYERNRERAARHAERISFERRHGAPVRPPLSRRQLVVIGLAWCAVMAGVCWLCTDAGMRFLAAIWRLA